MPEPPLDSIVRRNNGDGHRRLQWARSATKHRISRERSRYVVEHSGLCFLQYGPDEDAGGLRLVFLGDDAGGNPLEIVAVEFDDGKLIVIHAMSLRDRYRDGYEEAKRWRR